MDRQAKIDLILTHYEEPYRYGPIDDATVVQKGINPGCGDVVVMYLKVSADEDIVAEISFAGVGCTISQAAASMVTEMFEGKPLAEIERATSEPLFELLGRELAATRPRCSTLGLETAKQAVRKLRRKWLRQESGIEFPQGETVDGLVFADDEAGV